MSSAGIDVRWQRRAADIDGELWEACFPPSLEGEWWYRALEASGLEDQFRFYYGVVCIAGEAVAIAPAFLMDLPIALVVPPAILPAFELLGRMFPSLRYQRSLFVGSPCADEGRVGSLPGADRQAILEALQRALADLGRELGASMLVWKDFPTRDAAELEQLARAAGLFVAVSFPGTVADLPGPGKQDYLAALTRMRRHNLKKKLVRSAATLALEVEVLQAPDELALDELFALFSQTYAKAKTRFERLGRSFFSAIAAQPRSHFIVLRERSSRAMVAFMLCFALEDRVINKFIGIDYRRPNDAYLYFRLWEAALDWALARGARSIQSGQTGYRAKLSLGHRLQPLTNYCRHRNPIVHWVYGRVARTIGWHTLDQDLAVHLQAHPLDAAQRH